MSRAVMQQALEALEEAHWKIEHKQDAVKRGKTITALRAALAEPEQEPVGYWDGKFSPDGGATLYEVPQISHFGRKYPNIPVYAAPTPRKPVELTDEQIVQVLGDVRESITGNVFLAFARAIERAHGIGESK